jgi:hypothetical protein
MATGENSDFMKTDTSINTRIPDQISGSHSGEYEDDMPSGI